MFWIGGRQYGRWRGAGAGGGGGGRSGKGRDGEREIERDGGEQEINVGGCERKMRPR